MTTPTTGPSPRVVELLRRAALLVNSEQPDVALPILDDVLRAEPLQADALTLRGAALRQKQMLPESLACLRRSLASRPGHADTLYLLALVHDALGNDAMADNALRDVLAVSPGHAVAAAYRATRLVNAGRAEEAYEALTAQRRAGLGGPRMESALAMACRALRRHGEGIDAARRAIEDPGAQHAERRSAWFTLGHLLDAEGRYDEAFDAFTRANAMQEREEAFDLDRALAVWSAEAIAAIPRPEARSALPLFVLGMPRSGTTITEQILLEHPLVETVGELDLLSRLCNEVPVASLDAARVADQRRQYLERLSRAAKKRTQRVVDKMPENYFALAYISRVLPGATVVHCTRDARDTCLSNFFQDFGERIGWSRRLETCADQYVRYRRLMEHFAGACDARVLEWSNEALTEDPPARIAELLDFAGLERHPACLSYSGSSRRVRTASTTQVREGIRRSASPRWTRYEKHIGPLLDALAAW